MSRQDQNNVTVTVGPHKLGTFDKKSGGEAGSEDTKYRPGGMAGQVSLGGAQTQENVTVSRLWQLGRDDDLISKLLPLRGKADMVVSEQKLDVEGNPFGTPLVYTGTFIRLGFPDSDSESNDAALFELECSVAAVTKL